MAIGCNGAAGKTAAATIGADGVCGCWTPACEQESYMTVNVLRGAKTHPIRLPDPKIHEKTHPRSQIPRAPDPVIDRALYLPGGPPISPQSGIDRFVPERKLRS